MQSHISTRSRRDPVALEKRRLKAAKLFAKGISQADVARECKVSTAAACVWYRTWKRDGKEGLRSKGSTGPVSRLREEDRKKIVRILRRGAHAAGYATDLWTLSRIAKVIREVAKTEYHPGHVWRVLQGLGWSCQKPERRARERDEKAIRDWKEATWPALQKRGAASI